MLLEKIAERLVGKVLRALAPRAGGLGGTSRDMPDEQVTLDFICDKLVTWGSPEKVAHDLLAF
jgi:hypothetical protein